MSEPSACNRDFNLVEACLSGDAVAIGSLQRLLSGPVERFLVKAGVSPRCAEEIRSELLADLLAQNGGRTPLLRRYTGQCSLLTWLSRVALNQWLLTLRAARKNAIQGSDTALDGIAAEFPQAVFQDEEPVVEFLRDSIQTAIDGLDAEDFVVFQLLHREGLRQTEVAVMFGCDRRNVARRAERIAAQLRSAIASRFSKAAPLHLEWLDIVELCRAAATDIIPPE